MAGAKVFDAITFYDERIALLPFRSRNHLNMACYASMKALSLPKWLLSAASKNLVLVAKGQSKYGKDYFWR